MENGEFLKQMGASIVAARHKRKVSRNKLSRMCDIDMTNIAKIEKGTRSPQVLTLKAIADALRVDVKDFL